MMLLAGALNGDYNPASSIPAILKTSSGSIMHKPLRKLSNQVNQLAEHIRKDLNPRQPQRASQIATLYMFAKGYKSFSAGHLLFREGFWQDAVVIGRTLMELGFQARWLNLDPDPRSALFVRHELRDRFKLLKGLESSGSKNVRIEASDVLTKLSSATTIEKWPNWWAKNSNIDALAKELGLSVMYDLVYRPLCWFVHSAPFGNAYYLREEGGRIIFDSHASAPASKDERYAEMLFSSVPIGLLEVLAAVDTAFELKRQPEFDLIKLTLDAWYKSETLKFGSCR
jgi:hypothetical protein